MFNILDYQLESEWEVEASRGGLDNNQYPLKYIL